MADLKISQLTPGTGIQGTGLLQTDEIAVNRGGVNFKALHSDEFDAFVDGSFTTTTGSHYSTVASAVAAGRRRILILGDTTEVANVTPSSDVLFYVADGITWNLDDFQVLPSAPITITRNGSGEIGYTSTTAKTAFDRNGNICTLQWIEGIFNNSSTNATTPLTNFDIQQYQFIDMTIPDLVGCGIEMGSREENFINSSIIRGGGTSASEALVFAGGRVNNTLIKATKNETAGNYFIRMTGDSVKILDTVINDSGTDINIEAREALFRLIPNEFSLINVDVFTNTTHIHHSSIEILDIGTFNDCDISHSSVNILDLSSTSADGNKFSHLSVIAFSTGLIAGDRNIFTRLNTSDDIDVTGDDNEFADSTTGDVTFSGEENSFDGGMTSDFIIGGATNNNIVVGTRALTMTNNAGANADLVGVII